MLISNFDRITNMVFYNLEPSLLQIKTDINLIDPSNNEVVGHLNKGFYLKSPDINDLFDCDIGDNDRYKILIDLENIEREDRVYLKISDIKKEDYVSYNIYTSVLGRK